MLIYVAGPFTAPTEDGIEANVRAAIDAGIALVERGHWPMIPHLSRLVDLRYGELGRDRPDWHFWMAWTNAQLLRCDALCFVGPSPGATIERSVAIGRGMPVYERIEDVPTMAGDPDAAAGGEEAGEGGSSDGV